MFASCIHVFRASRHDSKDLSDANLFIADLNWAISFFCSLLWSLIKFESSSTSTEIPKPSFPLNLGIATHPET